MSRLKTVTAETPCARCGVNPRWPGQAYCLSCKREVDAVYRRAHAERRKITKENRLAIEQARRPDAAERFEQLVAWWRSVGGEAIVRRVSK